MTILVDTVLANSNNLQMVKENAGILCEVVLEEFTKVAPTDFGFLERTDQQLKEIINTHMRAWTIAANKRSWW